MIINLGKYYFYCFIIDMSNSQHRLINAINNYSLKRNYSYSNFANTQSKNNDFQKLRHRNINIRENGDNHIEKVEVRREFYKQYSQILDCIKRVTLINEIQWVLLEDKSYTHLK